MHSIPIIDLHPYFLTHSLMTIRIGSLLINIYCLLYICIHTASVRVKYAIKTQQIANLAQFYIFKCVAPQTEK